MTDQGDAYGGPVAPVDFQHNMHRRAQNQANFACSYKACLSWTNQSERKAEADGEINAGSENRGGKVSGKKDGWFGDKEDDFQAMMFMQISAHQLWVK